MGQTKFLMNKSSDISPSGNTIFPGRFARQDKQDDDSTTKTHIRWSNARRFVCPLHVGVKMANDDDLHRAQSSFLTLGALVRPGVNF